MTPKTVLLVSGLPLAAATSFSRQLELLGRELQRLGWRVEICDAIGAEGRLHPGSHCKAILLGYPEQFPFLSKQPGGAKKRLFLWCQLSRPAHRADFDGVVPVPLTEMTRLFLPSGMKAGPTIPHGVDTSLFAPQPAADVLSLRHELHAEGAFVVGTVGANSPRKRFDRIIESFALFSEIAPEAALLIKTDRRVSPEGFDLSRRASAAGVEPRVRVLAEDLPPRDMARLYGIMDVYLNLSEWEGFCIPVVEAMACQVPVVTHRIQGPGEILPYGELRVPDSQEAWEGGVRLRFADPALAASVLGSAYRDRGLLVILGALGRKEALERFDIRRVARQWDEFLS